MAPQTGITPCWATLFPKRGQVPRLPPKASGAAGRHMHQPRNQRILRISGGPVHTGHQKRVPTTCRRAQRKRRWQHSHAASSSDWTGAHVITSVPVAGVNVPAGRKPRKLQPSRTGRNARKEGKGLPHLRPVLPNRIRRHRCSRGRACNRDRPHLAFT